MKALGLDWKEETPGDPIYIAYGGEGAVMYIQELYNGRHYWVIHDFRHGDDGPNLVVEGVAKSKRLAQSALRREFTKWKLRK